MKKIIPLLTFLLLLIVVNLLAARFWWRVDLTQEKRYSLAPATKQLLHELDDVLTIRAYVSSGLPSDFNPLLSQLEDTLDEFKMLGGKKVQLEYVDPLRSAVDEQKAQLMGIPPLQIAINSGTQQSVLKAYVGVALLFADRHEVIPYITLQSNLEYELAQAVLKVSHPTLPQLAWYEGDTHRELFGGMFSKSKAALMQRYQVRDVPQLEQKALRKAEVLLLASPGEMREQELFELDQFLMRGGRVVVLADRMQVAPGMKPSSKTSPIFAQLEHYGVTVHNDVLLDASSAPAPFSGGMYTVQLPYPGWALLRRENFAPLAALSGLDAAVFPWASSLSVKTKSAELSSQVLASSSPHATLLPLEKTLPELDREAVLKNMQAGTSSQVPLAVMLSGVLPSAYGEQGIKKYVRGNFVQQSSAQARLLVFSTSRLAQDGFAELYPANITFLENIIDSLSWGDVLAGVRARSVEYRPLVSVQPNVAALLKLFNICFGPVFVLLLASVVWLWRRVAATKLKREYNI